MGRRRYTKEQITGKMKEAEVALANLDSLAAFPSTQQTVSTPC